MTRRRRIPWVEVANMAREAKGAWRLHPSLAAVDLHLMHHARRRVRALRPTNKDRFEFARGNVGEDDIGRRIFDLYVRRVDPDDQGT